MDSKLTQTHVESWHLNLRKGSTMYFSTSDSLIICFFRAKEVDFRAFRGVEVQRSAINFSHGLDLLAGQEAENCPKSRVILFRDLAQEVLKISIASTHDFG